MASAQHTTIASQQWSKWRKPCGLKEVRNASVSQAVLGVRVLVGFVISNIQIVGSAQRRSADAMVVGVWRVSELTRTGPNSRTNLNP